MSIKFIAFRIFILMFFISSLIYLLENSKYDKIGSRVSNKHFKHKHRLKANTGRRNTRQGSPADLRNVFQKRRLTLVRACEEGSESQRIPEEVSKPDFQFNVAPREKLIMCKTAKHGSTTLSQYFVQILTQGWDMTFTQMFYERFILEIHQDPPVTCTTNWRMKLNRIS